MTNIEFAIDLTWVRHKIVGGTESFVNNLIQGFIDTDYKFKIFLVTAVDNKHHFDKFERDCRIKLIVAPVKSFNVAKRIIWQNIYLSRFLVSNNINLCLEPVYSKPIFGGKKVKYVTVIHDLEALHYPKNHSLVKNLWLRLSWKNSIKTSQHIICISNFVKNDILNKYNIHKDKITTIYDPVILDVSDQCDFAIINQKYNVVKNEYYYTVSKLNPHKNLSTLIKTFGEIKKRNIKDLPCKLIISGIDGGMKEELLNIAKEYSLVDQIVLTGYVDNSVRNTLYANAKAFLFPSIFEGFGMPPVEAICAGTPVLTTKMACIPEVTQNIANYVENPYSPDDWIFGMMNLKNNNYKFDQELYLPLNIEKKYLETINRVWDGHFDDKL
jgi:glycosyltransferase involved in cell wall biosynthesis